eukprot:TRINITY_DN5262_c0_g1_i2.p1 TRINITY_DN5262_c0_g1~~TRINITY_DN5262_c0_g1_i2.p1  ORF type:complete len:149 (-),score=44.16 TRINITY_DN5262_c0_g1_i2:61-507(-)
MVLYRVNVLEAGSGACLFEKVWQWNSTAYNTERLCKMVLSFYSLAKEFSQEFSYVLFEQESAQAKEKATSTLRTKRVAPRLPPLRLVCRKFGVLIVALFTDYNDDINSCGTFGERLLKLFDGVHQARLRELAPKFQELASSEDTSVHN